MLRCPKDQSLVVERTAVTVMSQGLSEEITTRQKYVLVFTHQPQDMEPGISTRPSHALSEWNATPLTKPLSALV